MPTLDEATEKWLIDGLAEFSAGAGHELNNPLTVIRLNAQMLLRETQDPVARRRLACIDAQTARAYEMIADIRAFARPPKPRNDEFSVAALFDDWVEREKKRFEGRIVAKEPAAVENDESILGDYELTAAILDAFGKNAAEATQEGKRVRFFCEFDERTRERTNVASRYLSIGVENECADLADEERTRVFFPYYSGRQAGRGLGFGLPKARRFADALGARVFCEKTTRFSTGVKLRLEIALHSRAIEEKSN